MSSFFIETINLYLPASDNNEDTIGGLHIEEPICIHLFSNILEKFILHFKKTNQDSYLFLSNQLKPYTSKGIEYILKKYVEEARERNSNLFKDNYHNHSMRHTRAMHLLEAGVNLIYIRDFLGHSSISTTEIYAKTNPKIKEKEILSHSKLINVESKYSEDTKQKLINMLKQKI